MLFTEVPIDAVNSELNTWCYSMSL